MLQFLGPQGLLGASRQHSDYAGWMLGIYPTFFKGHKKTQEMNVLEGKFHMALFHITTLFSGAESSVMRGPPVVPRPLKLMFLI